MSRCFVAQPFDKGGPFDQRYEDVIVPAIKEASLEPYRVDQDPTTLVPIDTIKKEIKKCMFFLADISEDNPNVWFELGFATACNKPVIMICSEDRTSQQRKLPFDIQHRFIIFYKIESSRSCKELSDKISQKIQSISKSDAIIRSLQSEQKLVEDSEGLSSHELYCLAVLCEAVDSIEEGALVRDIKAMMERKGFNGLAVTLGLNSLEAKGFVELAKECDEEGYWYTISRITLNGMQWLQDNHALLCLKTEEPEKQVSPIFGDESDIPF